MKHQWCFNCKHFTPNQKRYLVDEELWSRQAKSSMPRQRFDAMSGESVIGECHNDGGGEIMLCIAVIDPCPGWESRITDNEKTVMATAVEAYEKHHVLGGKSHCQEHGEALIETMQELLPKIPKNKE